MGSCTKAGPCCVDACAHPGHTPSYAWPQGGTVDLLEEEMEQSVKGLLFSLDPSTAAPPLVLSGSALTVTSQGGAALPQAECAGAPEDLQHQDPSPLPQVCAAVTITRGQFYWEVDVCNSTCYRIGVSSVDNLRGWWLERRGASFSVAFDGRRETLAAVPPQVKTVGVFLNMGGGALSFHNALTQEHLATVPSRFGPGVRPALGLGQGRVRLRSGLPPPPHVFLCRSSAYRGPAGAGPGRWRRDVRFHSVRTVIQRFEELSVAESDSGLVSSFGSSSTLASLPEPGT
ncbi:E3 ubiquitin-protein ligase Midline-1-like [Conger conger]|uniref:E3 ubiquitin-protein ligase Midline-1-like n=1 Tax=Conger conger TaxID=82655 RepID=UPI002A59D607|nr:E3 ubiquitin-protein ligase Midline-1-like [Conger conger]